jgi:aryl-phospho-beta-D-glucosidase BglC (GH1 family)
MRITKRGLLIGAGAVGAAGAATLEIGAGRPDTFLKAQGRRIVDGGGRPVMLRGVSFGNQVWTNTIVPDRHHDARDFARVAAMGMNVVRFYLNYVTLEHDAGWAWIDRNIEWARRANVRLILNLHVPPGGFQSLGDGGALWETEALQARTVDLWREIARRYAAEPVIAGYDLLNEPVVTKGVEQWRALAQRIATAIRQVDRAHPVIVERVNAVAGRWTNNAQMNFVTIDDPNVIYTFHFYEPFNFSHQGAAWVKAFADQDTFYPDPAQSAFSRKGLAEALQPYLDWGAANDVPLYLGEFGVIRQAFEGDRGGLLWVSDMLDLIERHGLAFTYHVYHEEAFGLYRGDGAIDPGNANHALIRLLTSRLADR